MSKKEIGKRMRQARALIGLNRKDFCKKYGFIETTLRGWELGITNISPHFLERYIRVFQEEGYNINKEWLFSGEHNYAPDSFKNLTPINLKPKERVIETIDNPDNFPFLKKKDIVIAEKEDLKNTNPLSDTLCVVEVLIEKKPERLVGIVSFDGNSLFISNLNSRKTKEYAVGDLLFIARITTISKFN